MERAGITDKKKFRILFFTFNVWYRTCWLFHSPGWAATDGFYFCKDRIWKNHSYYKFVGKVVSVVFFSHQKQFWIWWEVTVWDFCVSQLTSRRCKHAFIYFPLALPRTSFPREYLCSICLRSTFSYASCSRCIIYPNAYIYMCMYMWEKCTHRSPRVYGTTWCFWLDVSGTFHILLTHSIRVRI